MLNSPRSLEACKRQGIDPAELDQVGESEIRQMIMKREKKQNVPQIIVDIRRQRVEEKRKEKIKIIKEVTYIF